MTTPTTPRALTVFFMVAMLVYGAVLSVSAYAMYGGTETPAQQQKATKASQQKSVARKAAQSTTRKATQPRVVNTQPLRQVQSPVEMWEMAIAQPVAWHPDRGDSVAPSPVREEAERARDAAGWNPNPAILVGLGIALISIFRRFRRF